MYTNKNLNFKQNVYIIKEKMNKGKLRFRCSCPKENFFSPPFKSRGQRLLSFDRGNRTDNKGRISKSRKIFIALFS